MAVVSEEVSFDVTIADLLVGPDVEHVVDAPAASYLDAERVPAAVSEYNAEYHPHRLALCSDSLRGDYHTPMYRDFAGQSMYAEDYVPRSADRRTLARAHLPAVRTQQAVGMKLSRPL